jgi:pimeloyl-ACP methyl ester carboxylesterase
VEGRVLEFRSPVDGRTHPYAVCATDDDPSPRPLLIEVSPGAIADLPGAVRLTEEIAGVAAAAGRSCIVLRPTGRGPGSVYQNYGEVDVLEAIEAVASERPIDRDRISVTGASMGGAATWYLASHYPDLFAAAAPFCGYCDHRLWEKPGGLTFPMHPWEVPSWESRSAACIPENLLRAALWIVHGEWDRSVGGGVSVEHSRQMDRLLRGLGADPIYTELPGVGHDARVPEVWHRVIPWLLDQRKLRDPSEVRLAASSLRHARSAWVAIEQFERDGRRATVEAELRDDRVEVRTSNVRRLALGSLPDDRRRRVTIDGDDAGGGPAFVRIDGRWSATSKPIPAAEKRPGASGPIGDLFFAGTVLVPGTIGSPEETFFNEWCAEEAAEFYPSRNGGVHRGGIMGRNTVELPVVRDVDLDDAARRANNLLLYGTASTNAVLARFADHLPIAFEPGRVRLGDRTFAHARVAAIAVFPHPEAEGRYVAVHGGVSPDAITWGSHLDLGLLPDYLVYAGGDVLEWGFFDNAWRLRA